MLTWASPFNICCFLDNQAYPANPLRSPGSSNPHSFECLLAAGASTSIKASAGHAFARLQEWAAAHQDWLFGHFGYDLAAETESAYVSASAPTSVPVPAPASAPTPAPAPASTPDPIGFPDLFFFVPEILIELRADAVRIGSFGHDQEAIWEGIRRIGPPIPKQSMPPAPPPVFTPRFTQSEYLSTIATLQQHILRGDCYEINFCQEFFAQSAPIDPLATWWSLSKASPNPFSAFYRLDDSHLICASPERYLKKTGNTLFSQPIKGTSPRDPDNETADEHRRQQLYNSPKDRSENVMVVDLVRNDLSRICVPGSVGVTELFGIYAFPQVFQMISTITGQLPPDLPWTEAIRSTFPMGSMTGAPKSRVVELIARYERSRRGVFSGAVGYVTPDGDFDFNVVIRSLLYNSRTQYLSYLVGSGITFYSEPAAEYEECLIKAAGIRKALGQ